MNAAVRKRAHQVSQAAPISAVWRCEEDMEPISELNWLACVLQAPDPPTWVQQALADLARDGNDAAMPEVATVCSAMADHLADLPWPDDAWKSAIDALEKLVERLLEQDAEDAENIVYDRWRDLYDRY